MVVKNMEIGNLLFGHSRGNYEVDRSLQKSKEWLNILELTNSDGHGSTLDKTHMNNRGGYENDTFCVLPYWWGDEDDYEQANAPNFIYKPTGFEIRWYKYPFRDSYMNMKLSKNEIKEIFRKCAESIKE